MARSLLLLLVLSPLALTQTFTYKAINIPGATETQVRSFRKEHLSPRQTRPLQIGSEPQPERRRA